MRRAVAELLQDGLTPLAGLLRRRHPARRRRRRRIVERPQQPGHIAQCARFCPALLHGPRRLALEVDDVGVALHHQDLAQMEIAVHPGRESAAALLGQPRRRLRQRVSMFQQHFGLMRRNRVRPFLDSAECRKGALDLLDGPFRPLGQNRVVHRLRRKIRQVGRLRQRRVQLAEPLADRGGEHVVCLKKVRRIRSGVLAAERLAGERCLLDHAGQEVERVGPAVALVADEALGQPDGMRRAIVIDAHHLAEQRRGVAEAALGQVARHLGLGMHPRQHAANELQHQRVADDQ